MNTLEALTLVLVFFAALTYIDNKHGSLTPEHLEITHKASNGLIFLSNF